MGTLLRAAMAFAVAYCVLYPHEAQRWFRDHAIAAHLCPVTATRQNPPGICRRIAADR